MAKAPRATSKNLNPKRGSAPQGDRILEGLPPAIMLRNTPEKARQRANLVKVNKRYSGSTGTGVPSLRFETESKNPTTAHIPPTHDTLVKLIAPGRVWVSCGCESFAYTWEYALTQHMASSIIHSNGEPAVIRNPSNKPGVCLHLYKVLRLKTTMNRLEQIQERLDKQRNRG